MRVLNGWPSTLHSPYCYLSFWWRLPCLRRQWPSVHRSGKCRKALWPSIEGRPRSKNDHFALVFRRALGTFSTSGIRSPITDFRNTDHVLAPESGWLRQAKDRTGYAAIMGWSPLVLRCSSDWSCATARAISESNHPYYRRVLQSYARFRLSGGAE
jgi:hypothetical protein